MKVFDNYLPDYNFQQLQSVLMGVDFPWFYSPGRTYKNDGEFQFTHTIYSDDLDENDISVSTLKLFEVCMSQIGFIYPSLKLKRCKANLLTRTLFHKRGPYHTDYAGIDNLKTAILYINTNNGYTKFKRKGIVKSIANRIVFFDGNLEHAGFTCTDEHTRVVVNFNFV